MMLSPRSFLMLRGIPKQSWRCPAVCFGYSQNGKWRKATYSTDNGNQADRSQKLSGAVSEYWSHVQTYFAQDDRSGYGVKKRALDATNVRELIQDTLRVKKTPTSDVMPDVVTRTLCECYLQLDKNGKERFFDLLALDFCVDDLELQAAIDALPSAKAKGPRAAARAIERIRRGSDPVYHALFTQITQTMGGMRFLVGMRADLLKAIRARGTDTQQAPLRAMDAVLLRMLVDWFSVGFLDLQRISWNSPAAYLEQVYRGEAVHAIKDWKDLKRRVDEDRRVFAFFHKSLPHTPLTVVHVALTDTISDNVQALLEDNTDRPFDPSDVTTAVFYSISSTQPGLSGADLGNFLIKRVVTELKATAGLGNLSTFVTLSPIPGFRSWLETQLNQPATSAANPLLLAKESDKLLAAAKGTETGISALKRLLATDAWTNDDTLRELLRPVLMRLCARYLVHERKRKFALDPVANFHVRNGASVYRINWLGDASPKGMQRAYGMMVNYRYVLEDVETNNERYLLDAHIATGPLVAELLDQSA